MYILIKMGSIISVFMIRNLIRRNMYINNQTILLLAQETTRLLNDSQTLLAQAKWADGESNTDTDFSTLACTSCTQAWNHMQTQNNALQYIQIQCTIPDINIVFSHTQQKGTQKSKIELKSSKSKTMPGSTIQKLDINMPLIYCLRLPNQTFQVRCAQYYHAIGENMYDLFQDRTPRPAINFDKMGADSSTIYAEKEKSAWINHYATCAFHRIQPSYQGKPSWQDNMVKDLRTIIIQHFLKNNSMEEIMVLKNSIV
mgnify:FL=1|jgi:hypothetical protein